MQTILKSKTNEVIIDTKGPTIIIGESINPTRRKKLIITLQENNYDFVLELAESQIQAGADVLDVNVGFPGVDDVKLLPEVVKAISEKYDIPLCLDSPNPKALEAALAVAPGKCLINSVNGEEASLEAIIPIAKEYGAALIGLTMDDDGITQDPDKRLAIAGKIIERAGKAGIPINDIVIDPLAMAVSADHFTGLVTLETIEKVNKEFGVNQTLGASNISFGLPGRNVVNQAFMTACIIKGVSCPITNPVHLTGAVRATDLLLGKDEYSMRYITHLTSL
nr:dihydropteroate synthase [Bacteroidota bacterium]